MGYAVEVWFGTGREYRTVGTFPTLEGAQREARAYLSDSRGVRILDAAGALVEQVKPESR